MLSTEAEAAQRWCPYALVRNYDTAVNRGRTGHADRDNEKLVEEFTKCRHTGCMAWRSTHQYAWRDYQKGPPPGDGWMPTGNTANGGENIEWFRKLDTGYCGRAGAVDDRAER